MHLLPITIVLSSALASAQGPTNPTNCAVADLVTLASIESCPGLSCSHASVLAHLPNGTAGASGPYSFVSGLTMPGTGREFALLAASNGLLIVDTHDLAATPPGTIAAAPWMRFEPEDAGVAPCTDHRGVVAYGSLIVESNLHRPYLRVFELGGTAPTFTVRRRPDIVLNPLGTFPGASYRLTVDDEEGLLFVPGAAFGAPPILSLRVFDLQNYPTSGPGPAPIWIWTGGGASGPPTTQHAFDAHVFRDGAQKRLAVSDYTGAPDHITILDISNLVRSPAGTFPSPYAPLAWAMFLPTLGTHSVWVDPAATRLYNSFGDHSVVVYDLTGFPYTANNIVAEPPFVLQTLRTAQPPLVYGVLPLSYHVVEGLGLTGYAAGWGDGLRLLDLRPDALSPDMPLAIVDTCPLTSCLAPSCIGSGLFGVWSVYRKQDSGVIYLSDQANGLFLVRAEVAHMHRYGMGVPSTGHAGIPALSLQSGPPRVSRPATPASPPFGPIGPLDTFFDLTVSNLDPGLPGTRVAVVDISLLGNVNSPFFFDPANMFRRFGTASLFPVFFAVNGSTEVVSLPLLGAFEGLPVFLQVAVFEFTAAGPQVVATSRGTFVGVAAQRN